MKNAMLTLALLAGSAFSAQAATYRVDDSASQVLRPSVNMQWDDPIGPMRAQPSSGVTGKVTVLVRLDVRQWKGKAGRIYMKLPTPPTGPVTATWSSRGQLLPGVLRSGDRTLVFNGMVPSDMLEDTIHLTIRADGNQLVRTERLEFSFEIDVDGP